MPQLLLGLLPVLGTAGGISAATALASTGLNIANSVSGGGGQPEQPKPPTAAENVSGEVKNRMQQALMLRQQEPGIQAQSPGVSPEYEATLSGQQTGVNNPAADPLQILMSLLNQGGGSSNPTDLMSLASGSQGGSITG